jgi:DNA-binding response OmpR family regulator
VILAEDNDGLRKLLAERIRQTGYGVAEAASGSQLIAALAGACFDPRAAASDSVVIADLAPDRLVLDVLRMLRNCPGCPSLIMVLPAHARDVRAEARQLGAAAILDKPLHIETLMKTLVGHLPLPGMPTA